MSNLPAAAQIIPAGRAVAITASGTLITETRAIFIETAGSFTILFAGSSDGNPVTMTLPVGVHPFAITKCTAGTGLWALY
jgi:hypothetical protein